MAYKYDLLTGVKKAKTKLAIAVTTLALGAGGIAGSLAIFGSAHAAPPPNWDLNGTYEIAFTCASGCSGTYNHEATVSNESPAGNFDISGGYKPVSTLLNNWSGTGTLLGNDLSVDVSYTSPASAGVAGTAMTMDGLVNTANGVMSGTWSDNYDGTTNHNGSRSGTWTVTTGVATPHTLFVQATNPTTTGLGSCAHPNYNTIQAAVNNANAGDRIRVCAGTYDENVTINPPVTLLGNNAGIAGNSGSRHPESVINGIVTVNDPNVTINGFTVDGQTLRGYGVEINVAADNAVVTNNIIDNIASTTDTAQAIYLVHGPDGTRITRNSIHDVHGVNSTKGVFIGDSNTTDPSNNVVVNNNDIYNITSDKKGAYAVTINNGSKPVGLTSNTGLVISNNTISDVSSTNGWVHAIGLEADTPGAVVYHNTIQGLNGPGPDVVAVWLENEDVSYYTVKVHRNNFMFTNAYGIAVGFPSGKSLNGTCNYWDAATGPSGVGPGSGAPVTPLVKFQPWLVAKNGECIGGTHPTSKEECREDGWTYLVDGSNKFFRNQGLCIAYVNHHDDHGQDGEHAREH